MYSNNEILERIKKIISENFIDYETAQNIQEQTDLIEDLGFESIRIMELVVYLEEEFDIEFDDQTLVIDKLQTMAAIIKTVLAIMSNKREG